MACNPTFQDLSVIPVSLYIVKKFGKNDSLTPGVFGYGSNDRCESIITGQKFVVQTVELNQLKWHLLSSPIFCLVNNANCLQEINQI